MGPKEARGGGHGPRVAYASELGCKLDVDLQTGRAASGAAATDNTGTLNGFLATASAANPIKLILDGPALVRGLVLATAGHTTIEGLGWGTGLYLADGANQDVIRVGPYTGGQTEGHGIRPYPARTARNFVLRDFTIVGNSARSGTGSRPGITPENQPVAGAPAHGLFGVALVNCRDVLLEHLLLLDPPCYGVMAANCSDLLVRDCRFESQHVYQDGVHVDGPCERVLITGCSFATGDDAVALNAPEGFAGDIEDVVVSDCIAENALTMMRVYTSLRPSNLTTRVRRVTVAHCTGTTQHAAFNLGIENDWATRVPDQIEDMLITGCSFSAPSLATVQTPIGQLTFTECRCTAPRVPEPLMLVRAPGATDLRLSGVTLVRTPAGNAGAPFVAVSEGAEVRKLTLAGVHVVDEGGAPFAPVPFAVHMAGRLGELRVDSLDTEHIGDIVSNAGWTNVGRVSGPGLLSTGIRVPDDKAAENTMYLSAASGAPSLRVGGRSQRLGGS